MNPLIRVIKKSGIVMEVPPCYEEFLEVGMKVIYNDFLEDKEHPEYVWVKYVDIIGGML